MFIDSKNLMENMARRDRVILFGEWREKGLCSNVQQTFATSLGPLYFDDPIINPIWETALKM